RLSAPLGGPPPYLQRDGQAGLGTGGNKARQLEYLLAAALESGADCVITAGSTQSNHARQTAAGAAALGLDAHLVLYAPGGQPPAQLEGNLLLCHLLGATVHWTDERAPYAATLARVEDSLRAAGRCPYIIPYGGSNALGLMGYVAATREVIAQIESPDWFAVHVFATSSGGTQAGMLLGAHLAGIPDSVRLLGISVDQPAAASAPRIAALAADGARLLGLDWTPPVETILVDDGYCGAGYAVVTAREREAIQLLARLEGILVDPVYTGRALAGLLDLVRRGAFAREQRVLFWHTGGTAALSAFARDLLPAS
ncbi:MAG: D-cysteine desulfhydrase family protein, partial [Anaerolineae bacterium]|nr:D-cysteine desulfhydrase family protein [Anaerolineae bacterium]